MKVKHIFLTGKIQVGKSTLIKEVLSGLENNRKITLEYDGFATYFDLRKNETRNLCIERRSSDNLVKDMKSTVIHFENGKPQFETLAYETVGVEILESLDLNKLLIFDECGKFEKNCSKFVGKIEEILNSDTHVFGVLRKDDSIEWLKRIAQRDDVCVIEVTEENRDFLGKEIEELLIKILREK